MRVHPALSPARPRRRRGLPGAARGLLIPPRGASRVGLFGGSFDPVHHAHLVVAQVAAEALGLDRVRFVPAREQPFKGGRHGAPAPDRARMLELAVAGEAGFEVDRIELERAGPSYTVDTLRALRAREPGTAFTLLLGADAVAELASWREGAEVARLAEVVAVARPGTALTPSPLVARAVAVPSLDISATEVRRRVREGRSIRWWVPDAVAEFIAAHGLYLDRP